MHCHGPEQTDAHHFLSLDAKRRRRNTVLEQRDLSGTVGFQLQAQAYPVPATHRRAKWKEAL